MLSFALEKQNVLFLQKDDVAKVGGMFSKTKLDGGSITAVMGSTSEKMYLCQVPNFGFEMIKLRPSRCRPTDRGPFNWSHASSWVSLASGRLRPE
jgi:hypothetical protein